jgi:predicted NUDIX family NTP pyrophosphohydrolase
LPSVSAGLLLYRSSGQGLEVFLVHPGGPFWAKKDPGAWTIPKGELETGESAREAALREFEEEIGFRPEGELLELSPVRQRGGKTVQAWALRGDCDPEQIQSNPFTLEWPPRSGRMREFPEVDRADWFTIEGAREKINPGQIPLLEELAAILNPA